MHVALGFSWFALMLGFPVLIVMVLLFFKFIAVVLNAMLGHGSGRVSHGQQTMFDRPARRSHGAFRSLVGVGVTLLLVALVIGGRRPSAVSESSTYITSHQSPVDDVRESLQQAARDLSSARQDMLEAVQEVSSAIPVSLPEDSPPAGTETAPASTAAAPTDVAPTETAAASPELVPPASETASETPEKPQEESAEDRQKRLSDLALHIGPWIRSLLSEDELADSASNGDEAQAAESSDKKIVVFQLPGPMRQKYALIPLTPAVDAAVSPMTPLFANGSLEAIANSLATFLTGAASGASSPTSAVVAETAPPAAPEKDPSAAELSIDLSHELPPEWTRSPGPGQFVTRTRALRPGDDLQEPLTSAVNDALSQYLSVIEDSLDESLRKQSRIVKLELDSQTAQKCIVDTHEQIELVKPKSEAAEPYRFVYALVEFPESVNAAAEHSIRNSLQRDRISGLAVVIILAWLAVCFSGAGIRLWQRQRRLLALPLFVLLTLPLLLAALGMAARTTGFADGPTPDYPWIEREKAILVQTENTRKAI